MAITAKGGRPPGLPKTGGRRKGTPNRSTLTLREKFDAMDYDPLVELAKIAMDLKNPLDARIRCHEDATPYRHAKVKPVDMTCEQHDLINVITSLDAGSAEDGDDYYSGA
jgi:hypothetical protein